MRITSEPTAQTVTVTPLDGSNRVILTVYSRGMDVTVYLEPKLAEDLGKALIETVLAMAWGPVEAGNEPA